MLRIALLCTALDWTRLDCCWLIWTWAMLETERNVLSWKEMNWNWTGQDWTGRAQISLNGLDRTSVEWTGLDWTGLSRTTSEDWTGRHCTSSDWTVVVWAWLRQTALHCTTLDWTGKYYKGPSLQLARLIYTELHSTFPKETDKDCTALYMNVLHWTRPNRIA